MSVFRKNSSHGQGEGEEFVPEDDRLVNPFAIAIRIVLTLVALVVMCVTAAAQSGPLHSRLELVAENRAFVPGKRLWVGLHFLMDPGWHIYWVNSGDSGQPPSVQWELPAEFHVGRIAWPVPKRLGQGTVVDYGYENDVLLMVPLQTPVNLAPKGSVRLIANVRWLVCREICIPAKVSVHLDLPVARETMTNPATLNLFRRARARLPAPSPGGWRVSAADTGNNFGLTVLTGRRETVALFFPLVPDQVDNADKQIVHPLPRGVRLTLTKSDLLAKPVSVLKGVLVLGSGRAYSISAPVSRAGK